MSILNYLKEQLSSNVISLYFDPDMGFDYDTLEEYMLDEDDIHASIGTLMKNSGIVALRDKELKEVLYDISNNEAAGVLYDGVSDNNYSFDIAVSDNYQRQGFATKLVDSAISEYENMLDPIPNLTMIADVVSPKMEQLLSTKNFEVIGNEPGHTFMKYKG